jgi:hypothetical protein
MWPSTPTWADDPVIGGPQVAPEEEEAADMGEQKIQPKAPDKVEPATTAGEPVEAERTNLVRRIRNGLKKSGRHNMKKTGRHNMKKNVKPI